MSRSLLTAALLAGPSVASAQSAVSNTVLWYEGNGGNPAGTAFTGHIQGQSLQGTLAVLDGPLGAIALEDYRFVVLGRPSVPFTPDEVAQLQAYLAGDGLLVIAGESNIGGNDYIDAINALLPQLGTTMLLVDGSFQNPEDPNFPGEVPCLDCLNPSATPFLPSGTVFRAQNVGDIDEGRVFGAFQVNIPVQGTITLQIAATQGRVVLTADGDLFSNEACGMPAKEVFWNSLWTAVCDFDDDGAIAARCGGFDCDDNDETIGSSFLWLDSDGDGYGDLDVPSPCGEPDETSSEASDCDDSDPAVSPVEAEICDGVDNDCSGAVDDDPTDAATWFEDEDGDGFGRDDRTELACEQPDDSSTVGGDCDDARDTVHPEATELCSNNRDDDCDGQIDENCTGGQPIPTPPPGDPGPCGCAATGAAAPLWLGLLGLVGISRRRARR